MNAPKNPALKKLRLLGIVVQPHLVIDDGENLEQVQSQPIQVNPADLDAFVETLRAQIAEEEEKLNAARSLG